MKKIFILFFGVVATTLFSQQCYTDSTLLLTDGERGNVVSFIFSNDLKYYGDGVGNLFISKVRSDGDKIILSKDSFILKGDKYWIYYDNGREFSYLKKHECSKDFANEFDVKLSAFKKINGY